MPRAKPARDLYPRAAEALGVPPDEYAVIEDYEPGCGAAGRRAVLPSTLDALRRLRG